MATRGVLQLKSLTIKYCGHSGSSRGTIDFLAKHLVDYATKAPETAISTAITPGRHPVLVGTYVKGPPKVMDVKNKNADEVLHFAMKLRNSSGRKMKRLPHPVLSENPTVQGLWDPTVAYHRLDTQISHQS